MLYTILKNSYLLIRNSLKFLILIIKSLKLILLFIFIFEKDISVLLKLNSVK